MDLRRIVRWILPGYDVGKYSRLSLRLLRFMPLFSVFSLPQLLQPFLDLGLVAVSGGGVEVFVGRAVELLDVVAGKIVRVFVALAVTEPLGAGIVRVAQVFGHGKRRLLAHVLARV